MFCYLIASSLGEGDRSAVEGVALSFNRSSTQLKRESLFSYNLLHKLINEFAYS